MMNGDAEELIRSWPLIQTFDLRPWETVVVAGAYKGVVMEALDELYHPRRIYGFEPQPWAYDLARQRLLGRANCYLFPFGIGTENAFKPMGEFETDACSFVNTGPGSRQRGVGEMRDWETVMLDVIGEGRVGETLIDLFVCNMEGYEFDLLEYMASNDLLPAVKQYAVQFHTGFGNDRIGPRLFEWLSATHDIVYDKRPQWVHWVKR